MLPSVLREEQKYSESELLSLAQSIAREIHPGDWILLEGPLGVGKTTFARALLLALGVEQPPEGSPTFAIVHEYTSPFGEVAHIDFYRLKNEIEIDEAGIPSYFWARPMIVISEWTSLWPDFYHRLRASDVQRRLWSVTLSFCKSPIFRVVDFKPPVFRGDR